MNEHFDPNDKFWTAMTYIDDDLLTDAIYTDTAEKLRKRMRKKRLINAIMKAAAACACIALTAGGLALGIAIGFGDTPSPIPPIIDNTPPEPPPSDTPGDPNAPEQPVIPDNPNTPEKPEAGETVVIDSIDKLNYYSALAVIENGGKTVSVPIPNIPLSYVEGQNYYFSPVDPNACFTVTKAIFFRIVLLDEYGFLASKVGKGEVDVVITENSLENMITFKGEKGWYTCLENSSGNMVYVDGTPGWWWEFSTHKYIEGFYLVKNTGVGNYKFRVIGNSESVTNMSCQKFNPTGEEVEWEYIPDIIRVIPDSTAVITRTYSFTIAGLEAVVNRKENEI
ncbi:MAG: hypothetical protein IJY04_04500 [Clostridia bacterium]|nr:hypothetical protein [Clostridia bacterium]